MEFPIDEYNWKFYVEDGMQEWNKRVLQYVYSNNRGGGFHEGDVSSSTHVSLESLEDYINYQLETTVACAQVPSLPAGRLGPPRVIFDVTSNVGSLVIDKDRLGVSSQGSFSSIRANCCVYKGKWHYELMLGSKGVMQVGWATIACKFSQEKGIGDTADSYSFDGNRVQKWNVVTSKYGEPWLTGDVIGCTINLDDGKVHFYRNGSCFGEAFDNVRIGPGMAYFPAVSLVYNENLVANFGASPLRYPIDGYSPLESAPWADTLKAERLLFWLERFLPFYGQDAHTVNEQLISTDNYGWMRLPERGRKSSMLLIVMPLMQHLGPLLASPYITEACLLPFLFKLCNMSPWKLGLSQDSLEKNGKVLTLLDIVWAIMEEHEVHECIDNLIVSLLTGYRFSSSTIDFYYQRCYLMLTLQILNHDSTRHYLLQDVLFDKIKFPVFLEVKPLDNLVLNKVIHTVWFDTGKDQLDGEELQRKIAYQSSYVHLEKGVIELQKLQFQILTQIFKTSDRKNDLTSRSLFLLKFGEFLQENSGGSRIPMVHLCPLPVALAFFHRLISLFRHYFNTIKTQYPYDPRITSENDLVVPTEVFYNGSINYFDIQRVGGLVSHLQKVHQEELREAVVRSRSVELMDMSSSSFPDCSQSMSMPIYFSSDYAALMELLDGIIRLYVIAAHRHLEKMCSIKETMQEYVTALTDLESRMDCCEPDTRVAIVQAHDVFLKKLDEQARHLAWVCTTIYSKSNRNDIYWLLKILLKTLNSASNSGPLFSFVPDFYVEACIKMCNALRSFFTVSMPSDDLLGWDETLVDFACFLAHHFCDPRIVNADLKDSLVQALAAFVCYPNTMRTLENMPESSRLTMVKSLLQPYESRAWAQSNWILVRLWKGCGFAFRYAVPPHLVKRLSVKAQQQNESLTHHRPCPSQVFQNHVMQWLKDHMDLSASFLSSVLNQLNWAFSEFIGMLQEIQNASNRPERVFIDSRQLKICATCFDLASALLRVLEMVIYLEPSLFTDWSRPSAEILLTRLCQLICQVLNRVTSRSGCFELVVSMDIPGLEIVDHFPILVPVAGILIALTSRGSPESRQSAVNVLIAEPSFQPSSLDYILGNVGHSSAATAANQKPVFSLEKYLEVSDEERHQVMETVQMLQNCYKQLQLSQMGNVVDEEALCTICYANSKSTRFQPCGHQSCRSCISLHLLHQRDCFFCKTIITSVISNTGDILNLSQLTQK